MTARHRTVSSAVASSIVVLALVFTGDARADQPPDPNAVAAVKAYVGALAQMRTGDAFAALTPEEQRYFGDAQNFASNYTSTGFRLIRWSVASASAHNASLVEVDVDETTAFFDIDSGRTMNAHLTEPYFALREAGRWGVKEIYVPWKSYAPKAQGRAGGLEVVVDRVEFYDRRVQIDCTLRDVGTKPLQVLPLLQSRLTLGGSSSPAFSDPSFPLNDRLFYDGVRLYPNHQVVGYMNFTLASRADKSYTARLTIGPVVEDGAPKPASVSVGPFALTKL